MMDDKQARTERFAPCPTCGQYSHSIGEDALSAALMHFEAMYAHPLRGNPMGHLFDDATRDAAQVLMAAARAHRDAFQILMKAARAHAAIGGE